MMTDEYSTLVANLVSALIRQGHSFMLVIGQNKELRARTGVPEQVQDIRHLLLRFDSRYHSVANLLVSNAGLKCTLSFDRLYDCQVPWTLVEDVIVPNEKYEGVDWPAEWDDPIVELAQQKGEPTSVDNVIPFRSKKPT